MKVIIAKSHEEMSKIAADIIMNTINKKSDCVLGLATGSTPVGMYKKLVEYNKEDKVDFSRVTTFNLDEYRGIEPYHTQSYSHFMDINLFDHININKAKTHIPNGMANDIEEECLLYDKKIAEAGGIDVQVLGIGTNGHIGFNEPSDSLQVETHVAKLTKDTIEANSRFFDSIDQVPKEAITMGLGGIMKSKEIILLASGSSKALIISKLVQGKVNTYIPASILQVHQNVTIIVDEAASSLIEREYVSVSECPK